MKVEDPPRRDEGGRMSKTQRAKRANLAHPTSFIPPRRIFDLHPWLLLLVLLAGGCGTQTQKFMEPREIGDKVTESDLDAFLQVVNDLPDKNSPRCPPCSKNPRRGMNSGRCQSMSSCEKKPTTRKAVERRKPLAASGKGPGL